LLLGYCTFYLAVIVGLWLSQAKKVDRIALAEEKGYWQGEWICADCGYIYDPDIFPGQPFFEEQTKGFKCPQCSGPRRRYAKKVAHLLLRFGALLLSIVFFLLLQRWGGLFALAFFVLVGRAWGACTGWRHGGRDVGRRRRPHPRRELRRCGAPSCCLCTLAPRNYFSPLALI
jgi:rubredoxin